MENNVLSTTLYNLISLCCDATGEYALAIAFFTLLTKVILFPVSLWTHRNGIKMVELTPALNRMKIKYYGDKDTIAEETQKLYKERGYHPLLSTIPMFIQLALLIGVIGAVRRLLEGTGSIYSALPAEGGGALLLIPLAAGAAALALGLAQNRINPLQREQTRASQWATNGFSIAISLALGAFVPVGVGLYWICSNLLTIVQQLVLNAVIPPQKYVDYEALAESKKELAEIEGLSTKVSKEDKQREKEDYKRFFSVANKHLVFYSEKSGFYKYFQDVIEYLLNHSNVIIHYVTSDPKDQIFKLAKTQPHIRPYYIGEKRLITLFMKMDADIVVMTLTDLDNFYIKRSYVRKDVEYIYIHHGNVGSMNLYLRNRALAHYDTIFCAGEHQIAELRKEEKVYDIPARNLILSGDALLDRVIRQYEHLEQSETQKPQILIAPSWQPGNILDNCIDKMLEALLQNGKYRLIVRPHPEYCKRFPQKWDGLIRRYQNYAEDELLFQSDFSSNETVFRSDVMITDWSTISCEYSFATKHPVLFVDTPLKAANPDYEKLGIEPMNITIRNRIGISIQPEKVDAIDEKVRLLLEDKEKWKEQIEAVMQDYLAVRGKAGEISAQYILSQLSHKKTSPPADAEGKKGTDAE